MLSWSGGSVSAEDFSKVRCEDPTFMAEIVNDLKAHGRYEDGGAVGPDIGVDFRLSGETLSARKDGFICKLTLRTNYGKSVWGRLIVHQFSNGKISGELVPY